MGVATEFETIKTATGVEFIPSDDRPNRKRRLNAKNTLESGVIPAIEAIAFNAVGSVNSLTSQATSTPTAGATGTIVVPPAHDCVAIYTGSRDESEFYLNIYVNDGSTTRRFKAMRNSRILVTCSGGQTLAIGTTQRVNSAFAGVNVAASLKVTTFTRPTALPSSSGTTATVNCDKNGPPYWMSSLTANKTPHIVLPDVRKSFQINSTAARRDIFIAEMDDNGNISASRHVHVPANANVNVFCINRYIFVAQADGSTISVTAPLGSVVGGTSQEYRPAYTVTGRSYTVGASSDGLGGDQGTNSQNLSFLLKSSSLLDGDEIVLESGTYDMSAAGLPINSTNYGANAFGKSIRIRSATGNYADVTFTGASWYITLAAGKAWIIEGCTFNMNGLAPQSGGGAVFAMDGSSTTLHKCRVNGASSTAGAQIVGIKAHANGAAHYYLTYCVIDTPTATGDLVSVIGGGSNNARLTLFGCSLSGNGSTTPSDQILTAHSGQQMTAWHCVFSDATATGNVSRVTPDAFTTPFYLMWCSCPAANLTNADGLTVNLTTGAYFCNFPKCAVFIVSQYAVGCLVTEVTSTVTREFLRFDQTAIFALVAGNVFLGTTGAGSLNGLDCRANVEAFGNLFQCQGSSGIALRIDAGSPSSGSIVDSVNNQFISANPANVISLGTSANVAPNLINSIFSGYNTVGASIGASGANGTAGGNYWQRTKPTNYDTRFPGNVGDTYNGTTAPALQADGTPTDTGNCDTSTLTSGGSQDRIDPGYFGGIDRHGRALWLGGGFVRGPVEVQEIRASIALFPDLW